MNKNRVIQKQIMRAACLTLGPLTLCLSFSLSLSSRLGGAGDILLTFRKCWFEFHVCERARVCVRVRVSLCVCVCDVRTFVHACEGATVSLSVSCNIARITSQI